MEHVIWATYKLSNAYIYPVWSVSLVVSKYSLFICIDFHRNTVRINMSYRQMLAMSNAVGVFAGGEMTPAWTHKKYR